MSWKSIQRATTITLILLTTMSAWAATPANNEAGEKLQLTAAVSKLPLTFEQNQGQTDGQVKFVSRGAGYTLFLTGSEAYISLTGKNSREVVRLSLERAAMKDAAGLEPAPGVTNYFIGNDPAKWRVGVPNYRRVKFASIYEGIDLVYYGNHGRLEYDFVVGPGADPDAVELKITGAKNVSLDAKGNLVLHLAKGSIQFQKPFVYQVKDGRKEEVESGYELAGNSVKFRVGAYDKLRQLVIDPVLNYSSYLGGVGGSDAVAIDTDGSGNAYVTGSAADISFPPTATDACGGTCNTGTNGIYVAKINTSGNAITYLSIVGGSGTDTPKAIAVDASGQAAVGGNTTSGDFPFTTGAFQTALSAGQDAMFFKLNASGTALLYSSYFGTAGTDSINAIATDTTSVWAGGFADNNFAGIPATVAARSFQSIQVANGDGFVAKFNLGGAGANDITWFNFFGGDAMDAVYGMAAPAPDRIFITGEAGLHTTTAFPTTAGVFQTAHGTGADAFVVRLTTSFITQASGALTEVRCRNDSNTKNVRITVTSNNFEVGEQIWINDVTAAGGKDPNGLHTITARTATTFDYQDVADCDNTNKNTTFGLTPSAAVTGAYRYSTFAGGTGNDRGFAIAADNNNAAYVTGETFANNGFNNAAGFGNANAGNDQMAFVLKLAADGTDDYSGIIGQAGKTTVGRAIAIDPACTPGTNCRATLAGVTTATTRFNTNALQGALSGAQDGFVAQINTSGTAFRYATFIGGTGSDAINGIALISGNSQTAYFAGTTTSTDLPVTASGYQTQAYGATNAFVAKFSANNGTTPALTLSGADSPPTVGNDGTTIVGTTYTWTVGTTLAATNPVFNMVIPDDGGGNDLLTVNTATTAGGTCTKRAGSGTDGPGGVTCEMANLAAAGSGTVVIQADPTTAVTVGVPISVTGSVRSAEPGAAVTDTETTDVAEIIDPVVTASANSNVTGGAQYKDTVDTSITYQIDIFNPSANPTDGAVTLRADFDYPANFNFVSATVGCVNNSPSAGMVRCSTTGIAGGSTATFTVTGNFSTVAAPATLPGDVDLTYAGTSTTQIFVQTPSNQNISVPVNYLGPTADLEVTDPLTVTASPVNVGAPISIQAFFQNKAGSDATTTTTLTFTFDRAFLATGLPGGCTQPGGAGMAVTCTLGALAGGASGSRTITGSAPLAAGSGATTMTVTAAITGTGTGLTIVNTADDTGDNTINIIRDVNVQIANFTVSPAGPVHLSQNLTYSVDVTNGGPDPATNFVVTFTLPNNYQFQSSASGCIAATTTTVTCTVASLASAGTTTLTFITQPPAGLVPLGSPSATMAASVSVENLQSSSKANLDTGANKNLGPLNVTVERQIDLNITAFTQSVTTINENGTVGYSVTVRNDGPNTARSIELDFTLPLNYSINAGSTSAACNANITTTGRSCQLALLASGASSTFTVAFTPAAGTVPTNASSAPINVSVAVNATQVALANVDGVTGAKTAGPLATTVERQSNLSLSFVASPATPAAIGPNGQITYNMQVTNIGPNVAEGVFVDVTLSPTPDVNGFTIFSDTPPGSCSITAPNVMRCSLGQIGVGANKSVQALITPPAGFLGGSASKALLADSLAGGNVVDGTPGNNAAPQRSSTVEAQADLAVSLLESQDPVNLKTPLSYFYTVTNNGPSNAANVRVRMTTFSNSGRTYTVTSINDGGVWTCTVGGVPPAFPIAPGTLITCILPTLNSGASDTNLSFTGNVNIPANQATGAINASTQVDTNPASVVDPNAGNNTSIITTQARREVDISIGTIDHTPNVSGTLNGTYVEGSDTFVTLNIPVVNNGLDDVTAPNALTLTSAAMPVGTTYNAGGSDPSCAFNAGTRVVTCSNIAVSAPVFPATQNSVLLNVAVTPPSPPAASGTFTTTWSATTAAIVDGTLGNNLANSTVNIQRIGDVGVAIAAVPPGLGYVVSGPGFSQSITWNVTVSAKSPGSNASNVPVNIVLPNGMTGITTNVVAPNTCNVVSNTVNCTIATLNAGTSFGFQVSGVPFVPVTQAVDNQSASASINTSGLNLVDQNDPAYPNNATSGTVEVRGETDVQISIASPPTPIPNRGLPLTAVAANDDLQYTISIVASNAAGMHPAKDLRISHTIPTTGTGTTLVSVSSPQFNCGPAPGNMPCTLASLTQGVTATITVRINVPAGAVPTDPTTLGYQIFATGFNQTTIAMNDTETVANNVNNDLTGGNAFTSTARQTSDMRVTIPTFNPLVQQGSPGSFTINVDNISSLNDASNVVVTIPIAASPLSNSSSANASATPGGACAASGLGTAGAQLVCNIGTLTPGTGSVITLNVTPALSGQVQITPSVAVSNVDPASGNNSATATMLVGNTPPGNNVVVNPANSSTGVANLNITVTYRQVNAPGGNTTADPTGVPVTPPGGYKPPYVSFDMATTAAYTGAPNTACFNVTGTFNKPERTRLFAYVGGNPVDITIASGFTIGAGGGTVCGNLNLLVPAMGSTPVTFIVTEPINTAPIVDAVGSQSQGTGKGLTGTGVTLTANRPGTTDDNFPCVSGGIANATCTDLTTALVTWTGQFTDANQKQVQCVGGAGDPTTVPPQVTYPACLTLEASVPFGQQTVTVTITDSQGQFNNPAAQVMLTLAGGAATGATSVTLNAGQAATFGLSFTNPPGPQVTLSAVVTPATNTITCTVNPTVVAGGITNNSISLLCSTQGPIFAKAEPILPGDSNEAPIVAGLLGITALPLVGLVLLPGRSRRAKRMKVLAIIGLVLLMTLALSACGGGGGSSFGGSTKLQSAGTPKGTYTVNVVGKDAAGNQVGTVVGPFTIVVQ